MTQGLKPPSGAACRPHVFVLGGARNCAHGLSMPCAGLDVTLDRIDGICWPIHACRAIRDDMHQRGFVWCPIVRGKGTCPCIHGLVVILLASHCLWLDVCVCVCGVFTSLFDLCLFTTIYTQDWGNSEEKGIERDLSPLAHPTKHNPCHIPPQRAQREPLQTSPPPPLIPSSRQSHSIIRGLLPPRVNALPPLA